MMFLIAYFRKGLFLTFFLPRGVPGLDIGAFDSRTLLPRKEGCEFFFHLTRVRL